MFAVNVPTDHPLAPPMLSPNTRRYPTPTYIERDQVRRAVYREFYVGDGGIRPRNFSPARWRAAKRSMERRLGAYDDKD